MQTLLRINRGIILVEQFIIAGSIIMITLTMILNVMGRFLFGRGLLAAEEIGRISIIFITFIGLSYCVSAGKHINMLAVFDLMPGKMKKATAILISAVTAATMATLTFISFNYIFIMMNIGRIFVNLRIPVYWIVIVVTFGFLFATIQYLVVLVQNLTSKDIYIGVEAPYKAQEQELGPEGELN